MTDRLLTSAGWVFAALVFAPIVAAVGWYITSRDYFQKAIEVWSD